MIFICVGYCLFREFWHNSSAKFLSEEERTEVERRLKTDRSSLADEFNLKFAKDALLDWKIYVHMLITIGIYTPLYSISLFLPT
jgi:hypothetical protein